MPASAAGLAQRHSELAAAHISAWRRYIEPAGISPVPNTAREREADVRALRAPAGASAHSPVPSRLSTATKPRRALLNVLCVLPTLAELKREAGTDFEL